MKFKNPQNNYTVNPTDCWFYCLLFGVFYFASKGIWTHTIISLILALLTYGVSWLIYPLFAGGIVRNYYLSRGWIEQ